MDELVNPFPQHNSVGISYHSAVLSAMGLPRNWGAGHVFARPAGNVMFYWICMPLIFGFETTGTRSVPSSEKVKVCTEIQTYSVWPRKP